MRLSDCHNIDDFRGLAKQRLPWPVFDYIDGAADDELTKARNTAAYDRADLVPEVLAGVAEIDTSCTIMGRKSALPLLLSPTALQRVFHWQGERAVARAAEKFGLWCGISSLATVSIEEIGALIESPKLFQLYVHKDQGLNRSMIASAPISTARRASAALITPLRQKVPPQSCRIRAAVSQVIAVSSMVLKYSAIETAWPVPSLTCVSRLGSANFSRKT